MTEIILPKCENCGNEYLPTSPRQRYCRELTCMRQVALMRVKQSRAKKLQNPPIPGLFSDEKKN